MARLIRWDTPFTETRDTFVSLIIRTGEWAGEMLAIVDPGGIGRYPKYLVDFGFVIAFTCMEEACCPERDLGELVVEEPGLTAYECLDSPWLLSYEGISRKSLRHFLIHGGDNNIEVITPNTPTIETISLSRTLSLEYKI
jgi:hypothetical protein